MKTFVAALLAAGAAASAGPALAQTGDFSTHPGASARYGVSLQPRARHLHEGGCVDGWCQATTHAAGHSACDCVDGRCGCLPGDCQNGQCGPECDPELCSCDDAYCDDAYCDDAYCDDAYCDDAYCDDAYCDDAYCDDAYCDDAYCDDAYCDDAYCDDAYCDDVRCNHDGLRSYSTGHLCTDGSCDHASPAPLQAVDHNRHRFHSLSTGRQRVMPAATMPRPSLRSARPFMDDVSWPSGGRRIDTGYRYDDFIPPTSSYPAARNLPYQNSVGAGDLFEEGF